MEKLLKERKTDLLEKFISAKKRPFSAHLTLDSKGKLGWEFAPRPAKAGAKKAGAKTKMPETAVESTEVSSTTTNTEPQATESASPTEAKPAKVPAKKRTRTSTAKKKPAEGE
jgi:DNA topoisomerase III